MDVVPFFTPADSLTGHCTVAVTGAHFVKITANIQADGAYSIGLPTGSGDDCVGVVMRDGAIGDRVPFMTEGVLPVVCGAVALTAGMMVQTNAIGEAIVLAAGQKLGRVMADCAIGAIAQVKML